MSSEVLKHGPARRLPRSIHQSALGEQHQKFWWQIRWKVGGPKTGDNAPEFLSTHLSGLPFSCSYVSMFLHCPYAMQAFVHQWVSPSPDLSATSVWWLLREILVDFKRNPLKEVPSSVFPQSNHGSSILLHWMGDGESSLNAQIEAFWKQLKNIARGSTDPGYWVHNLSKSLN